MAPYRVTITGNEQGVAFPRCHTFEPEVLDEGGSSVRLSVASIEDAPILKLGPDTEVLVIDTTDCKKIFPLRARAMLAISQRLVSRTSVCYNCDAWSSRRQVPHGARRGRVRTARGSSKPGPDETQSEAGNSFSGEVHGECPGSHHVMPWGILGYRGVAPQLHALHAQRSTGGQGARSCALAAYRP